MDAIQPVLQVLSGLPGGGGNSIPGIPSGGMPPIQENPNPAPIYGPGRYPWDEKIGPEELEQIKKLLPLSRIP